MSCPVDAHLGSRDRSSISKNHSLVALPAITTVLFTGGALAPISSGSPQNGVILSVAALGLCAVSVLAWMVLSKRGEPRMSEDDLSRCREIIAAAPDGILLVRPDGRIEAANERLEEMTGFSSSQLENEPVERLVPEPVRERHGAWRDVYLEDEPETRPMGGEDLDLEILTASGESIPVLISLSPVRLAGQDYVIAAVRDDRERRRLAEARDRARERYARLFEGVSEGVFIADRRGRVLEANDAFRELFGFEERGPGELEVATLFADSEQAASLLEAMEHDEATEREAKLVTEDGSCLYCLMSALPLGRDPDRGPVFAVLLRDLTARRELEDDLRHRALHDELTDLPNRTLLEEHLGQALRRARRSGETVAVAFLDLDGFKAINESFGHATGDRYLKEFARTMDDIRREHDVLARYGGDEFVLVLERLDGGGQAESVMSRLLNELPDHIEMAGRLLPLHVSAGLASHRPLEEPESTPTELVRKADAAMFHAKQSSGSDCVRFDPSRDLEGLSLLREQSLLDEALESEQIVPRYQPILDLRSDRPFAVEVLARCRSPGKGGLLPPSEFLPLARNAGLMVDLTRQLIERVRNDLRGFPAHPDLFVNLTCDELRSDDLLGTIASLAADQGGPAGRIFVEITEHSYASHTARVRDLREAGLYVGVDDFGTGYSTLDSLSSCPADVLKLDRSFVRDIERSWRDRVILKATVDLAERLDIDVIAEGIETETQLGFLRDGLGVSSGQGFLLDRPLGPDEVLARFTASTATGTAD